MRDELRGRFKRVRNDPFSWVLTPAVKREIERALPFERPANVYLYTDPERDAQEVGR